MKTFPRLFYYARQDWKSSDCKAFVVCFVKLNERSEFCFNLMWKRDFFTNLKSTILEDFKMVTKKRNSNFFLVNSLLSSGCLKKKIKNLLLVQMVWRFFGWTPFDHGLLICVYLESGDLSRMEAYADSYGLSLEWRPSFSCWKALNKKRRRTKKQRRRETTQLLLFLLFFSYLSSNCGCRRFSSVFLGFKG